MIVLTMVNEFIGEIKGLCHEHEYLEQSLIIFDIFLKSMKSEKQGENKDLYRL